MRIVVDMDDVMCDWIGRILEWWNEDHGTSLTPGDITTWNFGAMFGGESEYFCRAACRYPEFYRDLDPLPGAIEGMAELHDMGHDLVIATAVPHMAPFAYVGKVEWLRRNMPWFPLNSLVSIHRKYLISGDIIFDDNPRNIRQWGETGRHAVIMDRPCNRDPSLLGPLALAPGTKMPRLLRVSSWDEFVGLVVTSSSLGVPA